MRLALVYHEPGWLWRVIFVFTDERECEEAAKVFEMCDYERILACDGRWDSACTAEHQLYFLSMPEGRYTAEFDCQGRLFRTRASVVLVGAGFSPVIQ